MSSIRSKSVRQFIREHLEVIALAVLLALVLRYFVISAYKIPSDAMAPNLIVGDMIFGYRVPYGFRVPVLGTKIGPVDIPNPGDAIIFQVKDENKEYRTYIKRVVGIPGDQVEIRAGRVFLNGVSLEYSESKEVAWTFGPVDSTLERNRSESYRIFLPKDPSQLNKEAVLVPADHVYVLADNRQMADDSRQFGPIRVQNIEARATRIWLSLKWSDGSFWPSVRKERFFRRVP